LLTFQCNRSGNLNSQVSSKRPRAVRLSLHQRPGFDFWHNLYAATPDLYPNNAHHKLGWVLTWVAIAQGFMALVNTYGGRWDARDQDGKRGAFIPVSTEAMAEHQRLMTYDSRFSGDSGHGTERNTESLLSQSCSPSVEHTHLDMPDLRREFEESEQAEKQTLRHRSRLEQFLVKRLSGLSRFKILSIFDFFYNVVDRVILILAFVAYMTGLVTYSGIFVSLIDLVTSASR